MTDTTQKSLEDALAGLADAMKTPEFWAQSVGELMTQAMKAGFIIKTDYCLACQCHHIAIGLIADNPEVQPGAKHDHSIH